LYEVLEKLQKKNIPAFVDYHKIYDPANLLIRHEYLRGDYGRILHVYSQMTQRKDMIDIFESWLGQSPPGAINHYLGSHYIHMTAFISGAKPLNVRATAQYGIVREKFNKPIADIMETQVEWISPNNERFVSYHISGWSDPSETESMTYQELQMLTEKGRIDSDQRFRGFRKVISGAGMSAPNPHFFCPLPGPDGETDLQGQYGYRSVKEFVKTCLSWYTNPHSWGKSLLVNPTLEESEVVTAVLEAADMSLAENSRIVDICIVNDRYRCK
jgi:D-galacturonate reductase